MKVHLHIGAHKTGTTRIQRKLQSVNAELSAMYNVAYFGPAIIRGKYTLAANAEGPGTNRWRVMRQNSLRKNMQSMICSEENIIGGLKIALETGLIYPKVENRLVDVVAEFSEDELFILISIRSYETFFSSAYAQICRIQPLQLFDTYKKKMLGLSRRWPGIVVNIRKMFPSVQVIVWDFENGMAHFEDVLKLVSGVPELDLGGIDNKHIYQSPSGKAVQILAQESERLERTERANIIRRYPVPEYDKFQPWTQVESDALRTAYAQDLKQLRASKDPGLRFVDFGPDPRPVERTSIFTKILEKF